MRPDSQLTELSGSGLPPRLILSLTLPLSLLPPLALYHGGPALARIAGTSLSASFWFHAALLVLVAEWLTLPVLAAQLRRLTASRQRPLERIDAFATATLIALPLWLAGASVLTPNIVFIATAFAIALGLSVRQLYRSLRRLLVDDGTVLAADLAYRTSSALLLAWLLLLVLLLWPLLH